jgi:hypothetical protein
MLITMAPDNVRLNYTISNSIDDLLSGYCEITGRTASDLVRQLVCEVLEDDRPLPPPADIVAFVRDGDRRDRRTDMWMSAHSLTTFDKKLTEDGYPGKSAVIAFLLNEFLSTRANHAGTEMVRIAPFIDRITFTKLAMVAADRQQPVEELVYDLCKAFVTQGKPTT